MPGEHSRERRLAGAVRAHDRVHLTGTDHEVEAIQDLRAFDLGVEVADLEESVTHVYPTAPSRLTPRSFCASTANSIGSSRSTSLQNPFTIIEIASSSEMPRWRQ